MCALFIENAKDYGYNFIEKEFLPKGKNEYHIRDRQAEKLFSTGKTANEGSHWLKEHRHLTDDEIHILEKDNACDNWNDVLVTNYFDPSLIRGNYFAGLVRIGDVKKGVLKFHDFTLHTGIVESRIISCDIGDNCAIHKCPYISHYIIGNNALLYMNNEIDATNHSKAGNGMVKDGEDESVRVWIDPINESGGRSVLPFKDMICADAYLWATNRDDEQLMIAFKNITQNSFDSRRGYYGVIGHHTVIKHCLIIKDMNVGDYAYVKGANKLKNITVKSCEDASSQIGEGVEIVNGIIGYGCHVFYGCKAVRFVLGNNSNLKYGARLINSILGDNSTISCCEVLNNLVFPAHEQHHNNSFLIASLVMGQSNLAAGATVGSNHNSRGNDGEIVAGRGFWPGLSSSLKHNSKFASFCLINKGNYPAELCIELPFALVTTNPENTRREVMPAYWWLYNMYALERNNWKYKMRDARKRAVQFYEKDYLAPDTVFEIIHAMALLEQWTGESQGGETYAPPYVLERTKQPIRIIKSREALQAYHEMLNLYAVKTLVSYFDNDRSFFEQFDAFQQKNREDVSLKWENLGGQLVPECKVSALKDAIRDGRLTSWKDVHNEYCRLQGEYGLDKALNALHVLRFLHKSKNAIGRETWGAFVDEAIRICGYIEKQVYDTKLKDYRDRFRNITYKNDADRDAVLGKLENNAFIASVREESKNTIALLERARNDLSPGLQSQSPGLQSQGQGLQSQSPGLQSQGSGLQSQSPGLQSQGSGLQSQSPGLQSQGSGLQSQSPGL
jgi:NDP-sugar pyrophosphorylase family protein